MSGEKHETLRLQNGLHSWISSIAMIQWGTARLRERIDIWWMATTPDQWVSLEIHDRQISWDRYASSTENGAGGIYGFMDQSLSPTTDSLSWATPRSNPNVIAKEEAVIDASPVEEHPIESSLAYSILIALYNIQWDHSGVERFKNSSRTHHRAP